MPYLYILKCSDDTLYTGSTTDLVRRLREHNELKCGAHYTKTRRPVELVYSEKFKTLGEAMKREYEIKKWSRIRKLALITKEK